MKSFAHAGDWQQAARLAAETGDDEKLLRCCLMAAFGKLPQGRLPDLLGAAELLASRNHHQQAILLFERGGDFVRAGDSALASLQTMKAAQYYQQGGSWLQAVRCFEAAGKLREALYAAERGIASIERATAGSPAGMRRIEELNVIRADFLLRLGNRDAAVRLLRAQPPSERAAELLALAEQNTEAVRCYLQLGRIEEASRLAAKSSNPERLQAQIFLETGRPAEAGDLFARSGLAREAAEAYEAAKDWSRAAYRWEAAEEPRRAAENYEKAGRLRDAARCFETAGMPDRAASCLQPGKAQPAPVVRPHRGSRPVPAARKCLAEGHEARAAALLLQMDPEDPDFAEGTLLLAPLLIAEGFCEDALERLRRLPVAADPAVNVERDYWEGRSLEALGRTEAAKACFERVTAHDPRHRDAGDRLALLREPAAASTQPVPVFADPVQTARLAVSPPAVGGRLAGRYEILSELGRGSMGRVYKARDLELDEIVAVKTMLTSGEGGCGDETRLLREVQICRRISHPNVVRVYDLGRFEGGLFVTMEYLEGRTLDWVIATESPLPFDRVRFLLSEIAAGLEEAHSQGVVHRDLKPSNVMVTAGRVKVLDFGIASMAGIGARLTHTGFVMGTPMYMAPEQVLGQEVDGRADLYTLGVLAYATLTGSEPFEAVKPSLLVLKQLQEVPADVRKLRPETPEPLAVLVNRLLAKSPKDRPQTPREVLAALAQIS